jgi:hypothetical protein
MSLWPYFFIVSTLKSNFVKVIYYFRFAENVFQGAAEKEKKYLGLAEQNGKEIQRDPKTDTSCPVETLSTEHFSIEEVRTTDWDYWKLVRVKNKTKNKILNF